MSTAIVVETRAPLLLEDDLPEAWQKVIDNLENVAHFPKRLDPTDAPTVDQITSVIKPPKSNPTTQAEVKKIFNKALICIKRFGGMIAQGASVVFGPSNQVFNAVSFLIDVAQDTKGVFDNLTALMERLSAFLERLNYRLKDQQLDEKLPKDLRLSVYRVLEQFVTIMALSYKLTHSWRKEANESLGDKWDRAKAKAKVFIKVGAFGDDSGVKAAIATFERLVAEVSGAQIDSIHRNLSVAARNICNIGEEVHSMKLTVDDTAIEVKAAHGAILENAQVSQDTNTVVQDLRSRSDDEKDLKTVRDGLGILERDAQLYEGSHKAYSNQTPGTGNWLFDRSAEFRRWMDFRNHSGPNSDVLALQGPEGYGKSYLCHAAIHKLQSEYLGRGAAANVAVCWYYFPKDTKKTSMSTAMWHLIWQLAKADKKFLKHLKPICGDYLPNNREDAIENWNRLVLDYSIKSPATVFFVVLDGLDHADTDEDYGLLTQIIHQTKSRDQNPDGLRIRFLISGRDTAVSEVQESVNRTFLSVNLTADAQGQLDQLEDLERYVDTRLGEMKKFQGTLSAEQEKLKSRILTELPTGSRGNYNNLKRKLNDIANSTKATEVNEVLERLSEDNDDDIERGVRSLNDSLSGQDIEQLNEILLWVSVAKGIIDGPLLDDILSKTFRDNKLYDPVAFVKQNCSKLLEVDENKELRFPSSSVETYLRKAPAVRDTVPAAQIDLIQAMLRTSFHTTFGGLEVYHKFDFDQFFNDKRNVQTTLVHLNPDANSDTFKLLEYCLNAICDADSSEFTELLTYANNFFDEHLTEANIEKVDNGHKQRLGQRLFRILREDAFIDRWATEEAIWSMLDWFDDDNDFCAAAINWLKDENVWKSIQSISVDTAWISTLSTAKYERLQVLQHVARRMLRHLYDQEIPSSGMPFRWIRGYFQKAGPHEIYREKTWFSDASLEEMLRLEEWARNMLSTEHDEAQWHLLIANVFKRYGGDDDDEQRDIWVEACNRCDKAMQHDKVSWQAQVLKGEILGYMEDYVSCIQQLEHVAQEHAELLGSDDKYEKAYWETVIPTIAQCHMNLKQFDTAAVWYRKIVNRVLEKNDFNGDAAEHLCALIGALNEQQAFTDSLDLLKTLDDGRQDGKSVLHTMLGSPYTDVHRHILTLAHRASAFADMEAYYMQAIQAAGVSAVKDGTVSFMEFSRWRLQWYCSSLTPRETIITEWEAILDTMKKQQAAEYDYYGARFAIVRQLGQALLDTAKASGIQTVDTQVYTARLNNLIQEHEKMDLFLPLNSKLTLARFLHLSGDDGGAKEVLRDEVRKAIKQVREEKDPRGGYELLASMFPVLDDDINAYAAWLLLEPNRVLESENRSTSAQHQMASSNSTECVNGELSHGEADNNRTDGVTDQVVSDGSASAVNSNGSKPLDKAKLRGRTFFSCDGACGRSWRFVDDMYVCKDCLCVQLDPGCYGKLKAGTLDITICSPDHEHLYIPPFDIEAWQALDPKMMRLGSEIIEREKWLQNLEKDWELEQETPAVDDDAKPENEATIEPSNGSQDV